MKQFSFPFFKSTLLLTYNRYFRNDLLCYCLISRKYDYDEVFHVAVADSMSQLSGVRCDNNIINGAQERFNLGHRLFYCCEKNVVIAYGWLTNLVTNYYAWEIANDIKFDKPVMILYDSYVYPDYRRRGIQKTLLNARINYNPEGSLLVVYAESSNIPSVKAITRCGFEFIQKLTHFSSKVKFAGKI